MQQSKILVIDNEPRMVDSLKALLSMEGYDVIGEQNPARALSLMDESGFDLIISDIKMPEIDGIEILKRAREKDPFMGVILITGYASLDSARIAVDKGAYGYLTKPLEIDELKMTVERSLEKRNSELEKLRLLSELKVANETLQLKIAQMDALTSAGNLLATTTDPKETLTSILSMAIDVIGAKLGSIMIIDPVKKDLYIGVSCGLDKDVAENTRMKIGSSISGYVAETGKPLIVEDIEKDPRFSRINRERYESKSLISAPLKYKDEIFGVINLNNKANGRPFDQEDLDLLNSLATPAAVAIDRANLISEKTRTINNLTILHSLAETVSMIDEPEKTGDETFDKLQELLKIEALYWYDYLENAVEIHLEFFHGDIPDKHFPDSLRTFKLEKKSATIGESSSADGIIANLSELISEFRIYFDRKHEIVPLPIFLKRSLAGVAILVIESAVEFTESLRELALLALTQTAAIYQRQKAVLNATRLVTMGKLLAEIGHDLKKPLTNLKGSVQIYKEKIEGHMAGKFFADAEQDINRLSELVKEMVEFSNPNMYQKKKVQISEIIEKSLDLLKVDLKNRDIEVVKLYAAQMPEISVNDREMLQVFINIILNAVDSMDSGGRLVIEMDKVTDEGKNWARISFTDTGCGIPEDKLNEIFARYYTTKSSGTGLGLPIVERIVSVHDGKISVTSEENKGTKFVIELPI
jgi:signal transduction histidine kinase/DNA-binding response OmpR family regulator/putative methionine-R-sulfoxide reductase with GAF domain